MSAYTYSPAQDSDTRCTSCQRTLRDSELDRWTCYPCEDDARTKLTELPQLYLDLHRKLAPTRGSDNAGHVTGATRSAPLPVRLAVLDLLGPGGIVSQLQAVEDDWRRLLGLPVATFRGNARQTFAALQPFLVNSVGWACSRYEDVAPDLKVIRTVHQRATAIVTDTQDVRVPIGCCPAINEETGRPCALPLKTSPWSLTIRCSGCGSSWARDEWLRLGATMRGITLPAAAA